jgi:hypothetical protein
MTKIISPKLSNNSRRIISTRRTSLIESDLSHITLPTSTVDNHNNIYDENTLKKQTTTKSNGFKRKSPHERQEKKRTKINHTKSYNSIVQTRSSSRLKQKHQPNRRLSTELLSTSTSEIST